MPPEMPVALVPVRDPGQGKTRLADTLDEEARAALSTAMLADVVAALHEADLQRIIVLASGPVAAGSAKALGVDVLLDPPGAGGLNAALGTAAKRVRASSSLVVAADLPLLTPDDVTGLVSTAGEVVVAPTQDGGTGGLLRRPAWVIDTVYGGRSAARHLLTARNAHFIAERADIPGFSVDVDDADDLREIASHADLGTATQRVLGDLDVMTA